MRNLEPKKESVILEKLIEDLFLSLRFRFQCLFLFVRRSRTTMPQNNIVVPLSTEKLYWLNVWAVNLLWTLFLLDRIYVVCVHHAQHVKVMTGTHAKKNERFYLRAKKYETINIAKPQQERNEEEIKQMLGWVERMWVGGKKKGNMKQRSQKSILTLNGLSGYQCPWNLCFNAFSTSSPNMLTRRRGSLL